jgi:hypothetical protein
MRSDSVLLFSNKDFVTKVKVKQRISYGKTHYSAADD